MKFQYYNGKKLDLNTYGMALSLEKQGIAFELLIVREIERDKFYKYSVVFDINGTTYSYKKGMLKKFVYIDGVENLIHYNDYVNILVTDKQRTKDHIEAQGIRVPRGFSFRRNKLERVMDAFHSLRKPLCVKPNNGRRSLQVYTNITREDQFLNAVNTIAESYVNIIVEEHIQGEAFRFFYVKPDIIGIKLGVPFSVFGDGVSSIRALADAKNLQRQQRGSVSHKPMKYCEQVLIHLETQGFTLDCIPEQNQQVFLKASQGISTGADTTLLELSDVHPSYIEHVRDACTSIPEMLFAGIDVIIENISKPASDNYAILEINSNPSVVPFYFPWDGEKVDIGAHIIKLLASQNEVSGVPIKELAKLRSSS